MLQVAEKSPRVRGSASESLALAYLCAHNCTLVQRNALTRYGEIDLIVRDGDMLVVAEVRYRRNTDFGHPAATVTRGKQLRIARAAHLWLSGNPLMAAGPIRFDIVAITGPLDAPHIEWIRNAFEPTIERP